MAVGIAFLAGGFAGAVAVLALVALREGAMERIRAYCDGLADDLDEGGGRRRDTL